MIKTQNLVPENYYNNSRDFQLIGRLFDGAINHMKTNNDLVSHNPISRNNDVKLLDLVAKTLGFESKHEYTVPDLYSLCKSFKFIMNKKGTKTAIEDCVKVLMSAQNITRDMRVVITNKDETDAGKDYQVDIIIPYELNDTILLEDMMDYVLPAGYNYSIIRAIVSNDAKVNSIAYDDDVQVNELTTNELGTIETAETAETALSNLSGNTNYGVVIGEQTQANEGE